MEAPPHYPGAPKKSKTGLILGGVALAILLCCCGCGALSYFLVRGPLSKGLGLFECGMAMGQQRDGLLAYAKAHGGKLPNALSWQDDIKPFVIPMPNQNRPGQPFKIPGPSDNVCDGRAPTTITMNASLAGKKVSDVQEPMSTVLLFETAGRGHNLSAPWKEPPFETSPMIVQGARRGWIRQPLYGQASYKDQAGRMMPAPTAPGLTPIYGTGDEAPKGGSED